MMHLTSYSRGHDNHTELLYWKLVKLTQIENYLGVRTEPGTWEMLWLQPTVLRQRIFPCGAMALVWHLVAETYNET